MKNSLKHDDDLYQMLLEDLFFKPLDQGTIPERTPLFLFRDGKSNFVADLSKATGKPEAAIQQLLGDAIREVTL